MSVKIGYQRSESNPQGIDFNKEGLFFKWMTDEKMGMQTIQCNSIENFIQLQNDNKESPYFFQVVRENYPVREYYDIDYGIKEDEKISDYEFISEFISKRSQLITSLGIPGKYYLYPNDLIILTAHSDKKLSFHIYSKKTGFKNTETHKQFSELLKKNIPAIDLSVYSKNRAMRLIGNSKFGQNRPLIPYDEKMYSVADTLIELNPLNTKGKYNSVDMVEFISIEKDKTNLQDHEQLGDISRKKFIKDFLHTNPWFQLDLGNKKLRRVDDGIRRPCLVNPDADHGTENMSINQYNGIVYIQCFQHKGKYKIPGQKEPKIPKTKKSEVLFSSKIWYENDLTHKVCCDKYLEIRKGFIFHTRTHGWVKFNEKTKLWNVNLDEKWLLYDITETIEPLIPDTPESVKDPEDETYKKIAKSLQRNKLNLENSGFLSGVQKLVNSYPQVDDDKFMNRFENNPYLFAFSDGKCIDIRTGQERDIQKEDYLIISCGYSIPSWDKVDMTKINNVLNETFSSNEIKKTFLSLVACYLCGKNINEIFTFWYGTGRNGKGILNDTIQKMLGSYFKSIKSEQLTLLEKNKNGANSELAQCEYIRCFMASEPDFQEKLQIGFIKKLTGGDNLQVRDLFCSSKEIRPCFTPTLQCNKRIKLSDMDEAIRKRIINIPFNNVFTDNPEPNTNERQIDKKLKIKIENDPDFSYGLLFLVLQSWKETQGIVYICDEVKESTEEYMVQNNPLKDWFENNYELVDIIGIHSSIEDLSREYITFSGDRDIPPRMFKKYLTELKVKTKKVKGYYVWCCRKKQNQNYNLMNVL